VQNFTQFVKINKTFFTSSQNIPEIMNPAKFKAIVTNPLWADYQNIYKQENLNLFTKDKAEGVTMSPEEESALKAIASKAGLTLNDKTIQSLEKSLDVADKVLDIRSTWQTKLMNMLDVELPLV